MGATRSLRSDLLGHSSGTHSAVYTFIVTPPALKKWKKLSKNFLDRFLGPKLRNFVLNITFTRGRFFNICPSFVDIQVLLWGWLRPLSPPPSAGARARTPFMGLRHEPRF